MLDCEKAYFNDPSFAVLVDALVKMIEECRFTPSELRQAAVFAAIKWEQSRDRRMFK